MTVYYDRWPVAVTDRQVVVEDLAFDVASIGRVWARSRGMEDRQPVVGMLFLGSAVSFAVAAITPIGVVGAAVAVLGALAFLGAGVALYRQSPTHEVWVRYRGEPYRIYSSREQWQANQLVRAVGRAVERSQEELFLP